MFPQEWAVQCLPNLLPCLVTSYVFTHQEAVQLLAQYQGMLPRYELCFLLVYMLSKPSANVDLDLLWLFDLQ